MILFLLATAREKNAKYKERRLLSWLPICKQINKEKSKYEYMYNTHIRYYVMQWLQYMYRIFILVDTYCIYCSVYIQKYLVWIFFHIFLLYFAPSCLCTLLKYVSSYVNYVFMCTSRSPVLCVASRSYGSLVSSRCGCGPLWPRGKRHFL